MSMLRCDYNVIKVTAARTAASYPSFRAEDGKQNTVDCQRLTRNFAVRRRWWNINKSEIRKKS